MHAVVYEDEKTLGVELKNCIGQKKPNQSQIFHIAHGECSVEYSSLWTTPRLGLRVSYMHLFQTEPGS